MVKLTIIIEGGIELTNASASTANNVEALRQSLHKLFRRILDIEDLGITIFMGWGYRMATKLFLKQPAENCLFVDSDQPSHNKHLWFEKLKNDTHPEKTIVIPDSRKSHIFFMVQEMEAWFLKQPDCLERWAKTENCTRKDAHEVIMDHSLLKGKKIEDIRKPSEKLAIILKRYYHKNMKAVKSGKLKTSPALLDSLDTTMLVSTDTELQRFIATIKEKNIGSSR